MRVHVWAENKPLPEDAELMQIVYPSGVEGQLARMLRMEPDFQVSVGTMQDEEQGLSPEIIDNTDVLVYWAHKHWREIDDERVDYLQERVLNGMGLIVLHSAHASKIFARLMGTRTQSLRWREADERQRYWIVSPSHPIAQGLRGEFFDIPHDETYGEYFEIPQPEQQVFITQSQGGEMFRSGCCWTRGRGKIFYFQAGHETYPVYYQKEIQQILKNAVRWAAPSGIMGDFPVWARNPDALGFGDK